MTTTTTRPRIRYFSWTRHVLAACVNYAKINNYMLRMRGVI